MAAQPPPHHPASRSSTPPLAHHSSPAAGEPSKPVASPEIAALVGDVATAAEEEVNGEREYEEPCSLHHAAFMYWLDERTPGWWTDVDNRKCEHDYNN
jgi:hypothetical protein